MYEALHELQARQRIIEMQDKAATDAAVRAARARGQIRQIRLLSAGFTMFAFALAAGSTALVLNEAGHWVYWVLAIWAMVLISRSIKLLAPQPALTAADC